MIGLIPFVSSPAGEDSSCQFIPWLLSPHSKVKERLTRFLFSHVLPAAAAAACWMGSDGGGGSPTSAIQVEQNCRKDEIIFVLTALFACS